jgi:hypothetical protein
MGGPLWSPVVGGTRATIKAHPTHLNCPRPYGIVDWPLRLMPLGLGTLLFTVWDPDVFDVGRFAEEFLALAL